MQMQCHTKMSNQNSTAPPDLHKHNLNPLHPLQHKWVYLKAQNRCESNQAFGWKTALQGSKLLHSCLLYNQTGFSKKVAAKESEKFNFAARQPCVFSWSPLPQHTWCLNKINDRAVFFHIVLTSVWTWPWGWDVREVKYFIHRVIWPS